ncbi:hypothetical protein LEN26_005973 [Aphanomyces euteiches]|nr:hypothetical protein AeMF1_001144 [Aphanomyces euteiches]KAH9136939.1 hypothetical protein LEN26_005973 [Aphanomyces euteiches]
MASSYERTGNDTLVIALGVAFIVVGTVGFIVFLFVQARRQDHHQQHRIQERTLSGNDMPLLSSDDMYPSESQRNHAPFELYSQYEQPSRSHQQLYRRETPLLERCGSSTVSDYMVPPPDESKELKPLTFAVERQRFNVQMRSSSQHLQSHN